MWKKVLYPVTMLLHKVTCKTQACNLAKRNGKFQLSRAESRDSFLLKENGVRHCSNSNINSVGTALHCLMGLWQAPRIVLTLLKDPFRTLESSTAHA